MKATKKYAWIKEAISEAPLSTKTRAMKHFFTGKRKYIPKRGTVADMEAVIKCALCPNMCKFDCPVFNVSKRETLSPSGKARISHFIETGRLEGCNSASVTYACTGCAACKKWCPFDFSVGELLRSVRADSVEHGIILPDVLRIKDQLVTAHTLGHRNIVPEGKHISDILYFRGCTVINDNPEIARAVHAIVDGAGTSYATLSEEWCCGAPLLNLGFLDEFDSFAKYVTKQLRGSKCSTLICSCPTCVSMFKQVYPEWGHSIAAEVMHVSEYIAGLLQDDRLSLQRIEGTYVYHDPCTLSRTLGIIEPPREVLRKLPGVVVTETFFNRELTKCCGRGGQFGRLFPEYSGAITSSRLSELLEDAAKIVTACPSCKTAFEKQGANVQDIAELVAQALVGNYA